MSYLLNLDAEFFLFLNKFGVPYFDEIIYFLSNNLLIWGGFLALPLFITLKLYGKKTFLFIFIFVSLSIATSDFISSGVIKPLVKRPRPCREISLKDKIYIPFNKNTCAGKYGFVSSHASNSFAIAIFFFLLFGRRFRKLGWSLIGFAVFICLTRIYLAKHYPLDLIFGALVGSIVSYFYYKLAKKLFFRTSRTTL